MEQDRGNVVGLPQPQVPSADESTAQEKNFLSREQVFAVDDREYEDVFVPEWKGWLKFRSLPADEALKFMEQLQNPVTRTTGMVRIVQLCAVGPDGKQMFSTEDLQRLKGKNIKVYRHLQDEAMRIIGFAENAYEYTCTEVGCNFAGNSEQAARQHAEAHQHIITVSGRIISAKMMQAEREERRKNGSSGTDTGGSPSAWR